MSRARSRVARLCTSGGLLVAALLLAGVSGCADVQEGPGRSANSTSASAGKRPVAQDVIAFLSKARAAHHNADLLEAKGELPRAIDAVRAITEGPRPKDAGGGLSPEVREVLADAHARLADLESRTDDFEGALKEIEAGLAQAPEVTHYRGHLFETRGVVLERRMKSFETSGDATRAAADRLAALEAFDMAISIQDEVITKLLPSPSSAPSAGSARPKD